MIELLGCTRSMANMPPLAPRWLWPGRIPRGKIVVLAGPAGAGKSFVGLDIAARITTGRPFPGQTLAEVQAAAASKDDPLARPGPGSVLLITPNEDLLDNVSPRLEAAQADFDKVTATSELRFEKLLDRIEAMADLQLIVIDPLSFLVANNQEPRSAVEKLFELYQHIFIRSITILTMLPMRPGRGDPLRRIPGLDELAPFASIIFAVSPDHREENPNPNRRVLVQLKNSLSTLAPPIAFDIEKSAVSWSAEKLSEEDGRTILDPTRHLPGPNPVHLENCIHWLYDQLTPQPRPAVEVLTAGNAAGFSTPTLYRAKEALKVQSRRNRDTHWMWRIKYSDIDTPRQMGMRLMDDPDFELLS